MKKLEFSKLALGSAVIAYFVVIALSGWATVRCVLSQDYGSAAMIIGATIGIVGTVTGVAYAFYSHKAKAENIIKIAHTLSKEDTEEVSTLKPYGDVKKSLDKRARETMHKLRDIANDILSFEGDKDE